MSDNAADAGTSLSPEVIKASGAGKAYQAVAQSTAMAVQDATANLRNVSMISTTTLGLAMANFLKTKDPQYIPVIETAQKVLVKATESFGEVGTQASTVISKYPHS